jgi:hypothetical protein
MIQQMNMPLTNERHEGEIFYVLCSEGSQFVFRYFNKK